jgi:4-aminobutyrate aminotransferase-like enzyme
MINGFDPSTVSVLDPGLAELVRRRQALLGPAYKLFYARPVEFVRGSGVYLYDPDGNEYLDAYNNVPSVGHANAHVAEAVSAQLLQLNTHTRYAAAPILDYAERLLATHAPALENVMFTCTGSEAVDLSLRVARASTGRTGIVVTADAYHGITSAVAEISPSFGSGVPLGVHVRAVPIGAGFADGVASAIADLERHGIGFAALIVDTIFSSDGIWADPAGFLQPVADIVHAAGGLLIADEVQAGFARTGTAMWGYQRHGIAPDLVTMGKPMGNGMPIGGLAARPELLTAFGERARYFNTFGGNSVCVAAASAVLDVIEAECLRENALATGSYLRNSISELASRHPAIGDVRGAGLYTGIDILNAAGQPDGELAVSVVNGLRDRRVLISATGADGSTLKIRPPLPFGRGHVDRLVEALDEALTGLASRPDDRRGWCG